MRIATLMSYAAGYREAVEEIVELEKAGLDLAFVPEAYGFDAPTAMGYLAGGLLKIFNTVYKHSICGNHFL